MFRNIARFWNRANQAAASDQGPGDHWMVISPDARVSLERNGAVFLHSRTGVVFTSNHIGARIWQGIQDHQTVESIAFEISRENNVRHEQVLGDTVQFLVELESQGFLRRRARG